MTKTHSPQTKKKQKQDQNKETKRLLGFKLSFQKEKMPSLFEKK